MKLASYRQSKKLTRRQAAALLGVAEETYRRYETGERTPSLEMITVIEEWSRRKVRFSDFVDAEAVSHLRDKVPALRSAA